MFSTANSFIKIIPNSKIANKLAGGMAWVYNKGGKYPLWRSFLILKHDRVIERLMSTIKPGENTAPMSCWMKGEDRQDMIESGSFVHCCFLKGSIRKIYESCCYCQIKVPIHQQLFDIESYIHWNRNYFFC